MRVKRLAVRHGAFRLSAAAAAAALAASSLPAAAQFYSYSGAVQTFPTNQFPIDINTALLDLTGYTLGVGYNSPGSFAAQAGARLLLDTLSVGAYAGTGVASFSGAGTLVTLGGPFRLDIGSSGTGTVTVSAGAVLDATINPAACGANSCYNVIGNTAGSTGTLNVNGAGSEVRTLRNFAVGQAAVYTLAIDGFDGGTPGGTTNAFLNVTNGGTLRSQNVTVALAPSGTPSSLGTERAFATVSVSGAGSRWIVTQNTIDNTAAGFSAGVGVGGNASITIANGGSLLVDGTGGPGPNDFVNLGSNGGKATLTVTGAGSSVVVQGVNSVLQVGRSGAGAVGSFNVLAGATASTLFLNIARDGATGTMLIDGAGSRLGQSGVATATASQTANFPAFASIGRDGGNGSVVVRNGGRWEISDGGGDTRLTGSPGIIIGRGANSSGSLTITGTGSVVEITSTSLGVPAGDADNRNAYVAVGYENAATTSGSLTVSAGGKLLLNGNAVSNVANGRVTALDIGGRGSNGSPIAGNGTVTVTGAGSEIVLSGYDRYIGVGRGAGGNGTLSVLDQGRVSATSLLVGKFTTGAVTINNATVALDGYRTDSSAVGAGSTIGRGSGGVGTLTLANGATFTLSPTVLSGGMSIAGDQFVSGGSGSVTLSGGSALRILGSVGGGGISVGRTGTGSLTLGGASTVDIGNIRTASVGNEVGGIGTLSITGGSLFSGNNVNIGGNSDTVAGGTGTAAVSGSGSVLRATGDNGGVFVGRSGTGSLSVTSGGSVEAIVVNVGRASGGFGTLTVSGATMLMSGEQTSMPNPSGAGFRVGVRDGTGVATITGGSTVSIQNTGTLGAGMNVGGSSTQPLGTGTLTVNGGSSITITAPSGSNVARIGYDGTGTATFAGASSLAVAGGQVLVGATSTGIGTLNVVSGSTVTASYVGIGSTTLGNSGTGVLQLGSGGTVTAQTLEVGARGTVGGNGGVIVGSVINRGMFSPGDSPGRVTINGGFDNDVGATLMLDVQATGANSYAVDNIVLVNGSSFDFRGVKVVFNFLGSTDPNAFGASGQFDLDTFLLSRTAAGAESGLSSVFGAGQNWGTVMADAGFSATSAAYDVTNLVLDPSGSGDFTVTAVPIPEPGTSALWLLGLATVGWRLRRR